MPKTKKPFQIHFVCRGNTYRSRLAAAYMATLLGGKFVVSSSGIEASHTKIKTVESYTRAVAKAHGLKQSITGHNVQTTNAILNKADVIVFMNKDVYDDALKEYMVDTRKSVVWNIEDVVPGVKHRAEMKHDDATLAEIALNTFGSIAGKCNALHEYLTRTEWVDVFDAENRPTGLRLPLVWVNDRSLWHRGVHVVVQTHDGKFVVGKRANNIVFAPGMLEITLGGGVDAGETVLQAAQRETFEEIGIHLPQHSFRPLFMKKSNHYHPHYKKHNPTYVYFYTAVLPLHSDRFRPQPNEVAEIRLLSLRQVKHLIATTRMEHFGRLAYGHKLYKKAVAYATHPV